MCRCDGVLWFRRVGAHQSPRGLCATGWGYPAKLPIPMDKIITNINADRRMRRLRPLVVEGLSIACDEMDSTNRLRFHERCHAIVSEELFCRIQKRPLFRVAFFDVWLREPDLNRRPSGYEPDELPDCSIPRLCVGILQRNAGVSTYESKKSACGSIAYLSITVWGKGSGPTGPRLSALLEG